MEFKKILISCVFAVFLLSACQRDSTTPYPDPNDGNQEQTEKKEYQGNG